MKTKFTIQDVIDMGAKLYDDYHSTRGQIKQWLTILSDNDLIEGEVDIEGLYDLIVG